MQVKLDHCRRSSHLLAAGLMLLLALSALAPRLAHSAEASEMLSASKVWLESAVSGSHSAALRMEVVVGQLDSRLQLAPCARMEPYIPAGMRLWGRTRLGLRCLEGSAKWNVFLPVTVRAFGNAWVLKSNLTAGTTLTSEDAITTEVDWAQESSPIVANAAQWVGQVATRSLIAGEALRQNMLRPAKVFQAGSQVRVLATGAGFEVTSDGQAVSDGFVGQAARVRMSNGHILSGVVLDHRTVKLEI